jgi:hypothetical protein
MIDSVYEYAGFGFAEGLRALLARLGLPLLVALGGTAWLAQRMSADRASPRDLGFHLAGLAAFWFLLSPTSSEGMAAPRFAVWLGRAADLVQRQAVGFVNRDFLSKPFEWERVAALSAFARVLDPALRRRADHFLRSCARPALAAGEPARPNLFAEGALGYTASCEGMRAKLWTELQRHVAADPAHRAAAEAARRLDPPGAAGFEARYFEEVCLRTVDDPNGATGELGLAKDSIGSYSPLDPAQSTGSAPSLLAGLFGLLFPRLWDAGVNAAISGVAALQQDWSNRFGSKQRYFQVVALGPHVYGFVLMLVLGLFPLAGLWALWPGGGKALLNWGKVFVSVKLWPVCWAALSAFNGKRAAIEAFDPAPRGSGDVFLAVSTLYLLVPAIAFAMVHAAAQAAAMPFAPAVPPPAGPGLGPAGVLVRLAK